MTVVANRRNSRADVVSTACQLFAEKGFHGTSMRDLGKAMGLLGSSLYSHVGSKSELLVEVIQAASEQFQAVLDEARASSSSAADRLRALVRGHVGVLAAHPDQALVFLSEARFVEGEERARVVDAFDRYQGGVRALLADGVADGSFRPDLDPALTTNLLLSLLNGTARWFRPEDEDDVDTLVGEIERTFIGGLLSQPATKGC